MLDKENYNSIVLFYQIVIQALADNSCDHKIMLISLNCGFTVLGSRKTVY